MTSISVAQIGREIHDGLGDSASVVAAVVAIVAVAALFPESSAGA